MPDYSLLENDYHGAIVTCLKTHFLGNSTDFYSKRIPLCDIIFFK